MKAISVRHLAWPLLVVAGSFQAAVAQPVQNQATEQEIEKLVGQLNHDLHFKREAASERLLKIGIPAKPHLQASLRTGNMEARRRAERLLSIIEARDYQLRLDAFADDLDGTENISLPGWERFREFAGEGPLARQLFVEMASIEPKLLCAFDRDADESAKLMELACALYAKTRRPDGMQIGSLATLLLVAGSAEHHFTPKSAVQFSSLIREQILRYEYTLDLKQQASMAPLRALCARWIARPLDEARSGAVSKMDLAVRLGLREEGIAVAAQCLHAEKPLPLQALLTIGTLGDRSHIPLIEPLLEDGSLILPRQVKGKQVPFEVRDFALAVLVRLSGQSLKDYGFQGVVVDKENNELGLNRNLFSIYFLGPGARGDSLAKWLTWSKENPPPDAQQPVDDSLETSPHS